MLDINLIRKDPAFVKAQMDKLGDEGAKARIDRIVELDEKRRDLLMTSEALQASP